MEPIQWKVDTVIDSHVHFTGVEPVEHFYAILDIVNFSKYNLMAVPGPRGHLMNTWVRKRKAEKPDITYIFGCMEHDPFRIEKGDGEYLVEQIDDLVALGFDGLKMLEAKPSFRRGHMPHDLDHDYWEPYFAKAEELQLPITCHVADPINFWHGKDSYQDLKDQEHFHTQALNVLKRHPRLQINFAHFFYMAPQLERLAEVFETYPGVKVDMAPGAEYLFYHSDDPQKSRDFYIKYADRILYGTDISDKNALKHGKAKADLPRLFLETDQAYQNPATLAMGKTPQPESNGRTEIIGIDLPVDVLNKIYCNNFESWVSEQPAPLEAVPV